MTATVQFWGGATVPVSGPYTLHYRARGFPDEGGPTIWEIRIPTTGGSDDPQYTHFMPIPGTSFGGSVSTDADAFSPSGSSVGLATDFEGSMTIGDMAGWWGGAIDTLALGTASAVSGTGYNDGGGFHVHSGIVVTFALTDPGDPDPGGPDTSEWALTFFDRDGTPATFTDENSTVHDNLNSDMPRWMAPVLQFTGQDPIADVGVGTLVLPFGHPANDLLDEDRVLNLYIRGQYVTSMLIGSSDLVLIAQGGAAALTRTWALSTLFDVLNEAPVQPPGGLGSEPAVTDRIFDWSDPARDNSDFTTPDELGTVTDAQTNYPVTPYAIGASRNGIEFPGSVMVIGPAGYGWTDNAPAGRCYFYLDHTFGGGFYRVNGTGDNSIELRIDGKVIQPFSVGFGEAVHIPKFAISAGSHRLSAVVENGGTPGGEGPCTLAVEFVLVDAADNGTLEVATTNAWGIMEFPANVPGMNVNEIISAVYFENVAATGALSSLQITSDATDDSNANPWSGPFDQTTTVGNAVASFLLKELCDQHCDARMRWDATTFITLDLFNKDGRGTTPGITLDVTNLGALSVKRSRTVATSLLIPANTDGNPSWSRRSVSPASGHPVKEQTLSLGVQHTSGEIARAGDSQLGIFGRERDMVTAQPATSALTDDSIMPGKSYWTADTLTISAVEGYTIGEVRVISMSWTIDTSNRRLVFTPEFGDLILDPALSKVQTIKRLAEPSLGGQSRVAAPTF